MLFDRLRKDNDVIKINQATYPFMTGKNISGSQNLTT
jgi:hypothetical protein